MRRTITREWMDDPDVDRADLARSLAFIRSVNRRLGGAQALVGALARWSRDWQAGATITLLDVATGSADIPIAVRRWALAAGFDLRVTAIDAHPTTLGLAREHLAQQPDSVAGGITLTLMNALELTDHFEPDAFDYAHAGMFLHHLPEIEILTALRMMDRLSRRGVVWNDLLRSPLHALGARALSIGAPAIVKHDALASVRAGFTRGEALDLARRVGLENIACRSAFTRGRFTLTAEK